MTKSLPPIPYSTGQFFSDVEREFAFLKSEFGMKETSSTHTSHGGDRESPLGMSEPARSSAPVIKYGSDHARVVFALNPRDTVEVAVERLPLSAGRKSVQELAVAASAPDASRYHESYDWTIETPATVLHRLAEGLRRYGTSALLADLPDVGERRLERQPTNRRGDSRHVARSTEDRR